MIGVDMKADIPVATPQPEEGYERLARLLAEIRGVVPSIEAWFGGINKPKQAYAKFSDKAATLDRVCERTAMRNASYPGMPSGFEMVLTSSAATKRKAGDIGVTFMPGAGMLLVTVEAPDAAFGGKATQVCRDVLAALAKSEPTTFVFANVRDRIPPSKAVVWYSSAFATFPHRKCLGWMGFVPQKVTAEQLPLAAEVKTIPARGTLIVSVDAAFDLNNKEHIKRANQVEMDMLDAGLLAVTDESLL